MKKIEDVTKDTFFKMKEGAKKTYTKGKYCKINQAWECGNWDDISDSIIMRKTIFSNSEI